MSLLLALLAQIGPAPGALPHSASPLPPELLQRRTPPARAKALPPPQPLPDPLRQCLDAVETDPEDGLAAAQAWLVKARGQALARAQASQCLGAAQAGLEQWSEAEAAFLAARDSVATSDAGYAARLGAMQGNAALAAGHAEAADTAFRTAAADAMRGNLPLLAAEILIDQAGALVVLKRDSDAAAVLAQARSVSPDNAQAWLLAATLSRRMGKLGEAQAQIQRAAELLPVDPAIGLEAGVIAVLSGRDDAARKSWQSVIAAAPASEFAVTARKYLEQLGNPAKPGG